jgi:hypothetical protein
MLSGGAAASILIIPNATDSGKIHFKQMGLAAFGISIMACTEFFGFCVNF